MKAERLLAKLQLQAEREWDQQWQQRQYEAAHPIVTQDMRIHQRVSMIRHLKNKTDDITMELEMRKRLKVEQDRHLKATLELREANLTMAEREARPQETRRGQILFSRIVPEKSSRVETFGS